MNKEKMLVRKRSTENHNSGSTPTRVNLGFVEDEEPKIAPVGNGNVPAKNEGSCINIVKISRVQSSMKIEKWNDPVLPPKRITRKSTQILAAIAANFGAFALGTVLSWTAAGLPNIRDSGELGHLEAHEESWIGSIATLGAVAACPFAGYGVSHFGRRMSMLLLTVPFVGGWACIYFARNVSYIYAGRFITGFCGGAFTILSPVFIAETADNNIRGALASGFDLMVSVGMLYIFIIGAISTWHTQALLCGLIPIFFHFLMFFVPESPRYLVEIGDFEKATQSITWFYGLNKYEVQEDLKAIIKSVAESKARPITFRKIVMKMSVLKPILVCFGIMFFTTMSGYDAVTFYTVDIFDSAGTNMDPEMSTIILGGIQVLATLPAAIIVDKYGRRFLLILSEVLMGISLAAMGTYFFIKREDICTWCSKDDSGLGWLPLTSLTVFLISYSIGIGPLSLMMIGELLPTHIKGLASCMVLAFRWLLGFGVTKLFEDLIEDMGKEGCYWMFSFCCFLGIFFVFFFVPETKGKSLDEIQRCFVSPEKLKQEQKEEDENENETNDLGKY